MSKLTWQDSIKECFKDSGMFVARIVTNYYKHKKQSK